MERKLYNLAMNIRRMSPGELVIAAIVAALIVLVLLGPAAMPAEPAKPKASAGQAMPDDTARHRRPRAPADLKITGPATANVGQPVTLSVSGIDVDLDKPLSEALKAVAAVAIAVNSPAEPVVMDQEVVFTLAPAGVKVRCSFTPAKSGVYFLYADWNTPPYALAMHRLTVGGTNPGPDPGPNPDPDPKPKPTELFGVVVEESSKRTAEQAAVLLSPEIRGLFPANGLKVVDIDQATAEMMPYAQRAVGKTLPQLYLIDGKAVVYFEGPMPLTKAAFTKLVTDTKGGGK